MATVIVITGPIASGKSTIAREVALELERAGLRVAVIDLDVLHDMVKSGGGPSSSDATWAVARRAAATLANTFVDEGIAVVVAEGSFNTPGDRALFADHLDASSNARYVTLRVSYEEALRRAQGHPTRGRSRDPSFLGPYYAAADQALATAPATDLVIDTERTPARDAAVTIARLVRSRT